MPSEIIRMVIGYPADDEKNPQETTYDLAQIRQGFQLAQRIAKKNHSPLWIVTNTKQDLTNTSEIEKVFGYDLVQALTRKGSVQLTPFEDVHFGTPASRNWPPRGIVLVIYPDSKLLDSLYAIPGIEAEIVVPWLLQGVESWIDTWGPDQLTESDISLLPTREINDPEVVTAANNALSLSGLAHRNDIARARKSFAALRRRGKEMDDRAIRAHALRTTRHGVRTANDLAKIAAGRQARSE